jgi:N-acetyl sugar amidotransferase
VFSTEGICPACNYFEALKDVDWEERYEILQDIFKNNIRKKDQFHDCIIGVSGGKDSLRQALWVREKLGLNPLLVTLSYPPEQVTQRGVVNLSNLIEHGFDVIVSSPAPGTWRDLKRDGFYEFTNSWRSTELALFSSVPQLAIKYGIKIILWGENPALQLGDMKTFGRTGFDGNNLRYSNTLSSGIKWILNKGYKLKDLIPYQYPEVSEFENAGLQIIYLGWFMGDWSLVNNASYSCANGLVIREDTVENTGDLYGITALDEDTTVVNQMLKYYKFGFGRVTDYVNEEIRLGRLSRKEGISLVERHDDACSPNYIDEYCSYLGISHDHFWKQVHANVNTSLFDVYEKKDIRKKFQVGVGL